MLLDVLSLVVVLFEVVLLVTEEPPEDANYVQSWLPVIQFIGS